MPALNYLGIGPTTNAANPKNGFLVLDAANFQSVMTNLPVTRSKTITLIQSGWTDGTGGFIGSNNYLTNSTVSTDQRTLQNILSYKSNVLNPVIQQSQLQAESVKYITNASVGAASGVASTDASNYVPVAQLPSMGSGYLIGPFGIGINAAFDGSATTISNGPRKIAEWAIGVNPINFQPLVFMLVNATTSDNLGRTVIEVRISDGPASAYSTSNPLVSMGTGRSFYTGLQPIIVLPCAPANGRTGSTAYPPTYNTYLTAWLYDAGAGTSTVPSAVVPGISGTAFLMRVLS
jgi:hypothetical protein